VRGLTRGREEAATGCFASERHWYLSVLTEPNVVLDNVYSSIMVGDDQLRFLIADSAPDVRLLVGSAEWIVKTIARTRHVGDWLPTIGVVNGGSEETMVRVLAAGADDCVIAHRKSELKARLCAMLRRASPDARAEVGKIELDPARLLVRVDRAEAHLTRKQFEVFSYLAARQGRWVHTSEILQEVYQSHHAPDTSLVRVQIHGIRRALGPARDSIESNGHRSYRLSLAPRSEARASKPPAPSSGDDPGMANRCDPADPGRGPGRWIRYAACSPKIVRPIRWRTS
jgi:DNA-binding response OmpR family regulator